MHKTGLKLWSVNTDYYYEEAIRYYEEGLYDFIELYVVPETYCLITKWKHLYRDFKISFTIHAPHFNHGVNLADEARFSYNKKIFNEVFKWADDLDSELIIFHPGVLGNIEETVKQLNVIKDSRMIVENKPPYQIPSMRVCRGASVEEIKKVLEETNLRMCLDIGHAMCSANLFNKEPYAYLQEFQNLNPVYYHLVDNFSDSSEDRHLNLGEGNYDLDRILNCIIDNSLPVLLETNKKSKTDLDCFVNDVNMLKTVIGAVNE